MFLYLFMNKYCDNNNAIRPRWLKIAGLYTISNLKFVKIN